MGPKFVFEYVTLGCFTFAIAETLQRSFLESDSSTPHPNLHVSFQILSASNITPY